MMDLHIEELETIEASGDTRNFVEGVATGLFIVAAVIAIAT